MSKLKFENETGKKIKNFTKGFYIALSLCMVAAVGVAWATFSDNFSPDPPIEAPFSSVTSTASEQPYLEDDTAVENKVSDVPAQSSQPDEEVAATPSVPVFMMPVEGQVINEFSDGQLIYSITMSDWRTHDGVDIKCERGTHVKAVGDGEVISVNEDTYYGNIIEIKHSGFTVYYCGMSKTTSMKKGKKVKIGDVIGSTDSVPCECLDDPHLHMAVKQNGKYVDPILALSLGGE